MIKIGIFKVKRQHNSASSSGAGPFRIVLILSDMFWTAATALVADSKASPTSFLKKMYTKINFSDFAFLRAGQLLGI